LTTYQDEEEGYEEYGQYDEQYGQQMGMDMNMGQGQGVEAAKGQPMDIQALEQNVKSIPESKDFQCGLCDYISNRPAKVKNHLEAIHYPGVFVYSCDICEKTFSGRNAFGVHKSQVHSKKKLTF
jgi:hypothetical protein